MIMFLQLQAARTCRNVFTYNTRLKLTNILRQRITQIHYVKVPSTPKVKPPQTLKQTGILLKSFIPALVVVKCSSKNTEKSPKNELASIIDGLPEEFFDWEKLFFYLSPELWTLILAIMAAIAAAFVNVQIPIHLGKVIDVLTSLSAGNNNGSIFEQLRGPALELFSCYVLQAFFTFVYVDFLSAVGENMAKKLKSALFTSIMEQDLQFFEQNRTGEIIDRLTTDVHEFKSAFKLCISQGIRSSTQILGCLISMISISSEMTAVMVLILPTIIFIGTIFGTQLRLLSMIAQEQAAWATILAEEKISNIRTVRSFGMEQHECGKFNDEISVIEQRYKKLGFGIALFQAGTNIFLNSIVLATLAMGGYMLSMRRLSTGNVMSFLVAMQTIQKSLTQISLLFGHFVKGMASGSRIFQFINLEPRIPLNINTRKTIPSSLFNATIQFDEVSFSYPSRPEQKVLKDFSLTIPAGKVAAIVGSSGNGKSTIATLLLKLYKVTEGKVKISDKNIEELDETWLRRNVIGFINQEPVLFATTIRENIRYGNPNASDEEIYEAATLANADEFIRQFPAGYDTVVGEKGTALSGGQKQRVALARAFVKKPMILVLDEATSALDTISEQRVQESLESVMKNRTVIVIAHRLSTIKNADIIVVLDGGEIVEMGKHDELMSKKACYWSLMNQQEKAGQN